MAYEAKILADSVSPAGSRLTTFLVTFPRIVLAEVNTHCMLSRNSASSRAIPVAKKIAQVSADPFIPEAFGKNMKGMQHVEMLDHAANRLARRTWQSACDEAIVHAEKLVELEVHKQLANRILEPFAWHTAILTATDWGNFFNLRVNPEAQGEFRTCAAMMKELYDNGPTPRQLRHGGWHLPLCPELDEVDANRGVFADGETWSRISVARCARVSFLTHDGKRDMQEDLKLYDRLLTSGHMSPLEHAARPMDDEELHMFMHPRKRWNGSRFVIQSGAAPSYCGKLNGWISARAMVPGEEDIVGWRREHGAT